MSSSTHFRWPRQPQQEGKHKILLLFSGLLLTMFLAALDQMVFGTALPTIAGELHGVEQMLWVTTAYILAATVMLPIYGKLGDLIGRRLPFITAICLFMAGSLIGGMAEDMTGLILGRAIQGLGGGGLMILSQAIVADVVPARQRGKYVGIIGGVYAVSSVAGPILGGWFTDGIGWRWALWMNVPLGALAIVSAVAFLHLPKRSFKDSSVDVVGMLLLAIASICLVMFTSWGGTSHEWLNPGILALIGGFVVSGALFVLVERRAREPVIPLHLFKQRNVRLTTLAGLIIGIAMIGTMAYIPTYLQMVTGTNATQAGLLMTPLMAASLISSVVCGRLVTRTGRYKWFPIVGSAILALALLLLATMTPDLPVWLMSCYLAMMGLGIGMTTQILVLIVQNSFPASEVGTATASNNYFRQIGAALGSAIVGSLFVDRLTDLLDSRPPDGGVLNSGIESLTPAHVDSLPPHVRGSIVGSYNDALTPIFLYLVPLVVIAVVVLCFLKETPLATHIDAGVQHEALKGGVYATTTSGQAHHAVPVAVSEDSDGP